MKRCTGSAKPHRAVFRLFARYYDAEEMIHKSISSNWEDISNSGPKAMQKLSKIELLMTMGIRSAKPHRAVFRFFARYYDAEEVIHQRISWDWEDISNSGSKAMPKLMKNWTFNEKVHRIRKTSQSRFCFFARYYDAEEVIHKRISWNWEDISNSGPKAMPKIIKNWTFNEKVHRIRKTSQSRFSPFCKILRCWRSDS